MNTKLLSTAVLVLATTLTAPLALADRNNHDAHRDQYMVKTDGRHDSGPRHSWWQAHRHRYDNDGHQHYYERHEYYRYGPEARRDDHDHFPPYRSGSAAPILFGSVIGGVMGHEISRGDPGATMIGAVIGTMVGIDMAHQRHR